MKQKFCSFGVMNFTALRTPHSALRTPHSTLRTPHSGALPLKSAFSHKLKSVLIICKFSLLILTKTISQECVFSNPDSSTFSTCYLTSGLLSDYEGWPCGLSNFVYLVQNITFTIDGDLAIDRSVTFKDCTFLFTENSKISFADANWFMPNPKAIHVTFDSCTFNGCDNVTWSGINYNVSHFNDGPVLTIHNDTKIINAEIGIKVVTTSKFHGTLTANNVIFDNNIIGMYYPGFFAMKENKITRCTFKNGETGIHVNAFPRRNVSDARAIFFQTNNTFENLVTGILCENTEGIAVSGNTFFNCNKAIEIKNLKSTSLENLLIRLNSFTSINSCAICVDGLENGSKSQISFNNIFGSSNNFKSFGIRIENALATDLNIASNSKIFGFNTGIYIHNSNFTRQNIGSNAGIESNKTGIASYVNWFSGIRIANNLLLYNQNNSMSLYGSHFGTILNNVITAGSSIASGLNLNNPWLLNVENNTFNSNFSNSSDYSQFKLSGGIGTTLCCNKLNNHENGLHIYGTNSLTGIRNTTFNNNNFILENSIIGENPHAGNRFLGQTTGILLAANPDNNKFLINPSEENATLGQMAPSAIDPIIYENVWFNPDPLGSSMSCAPGCGFNRRSFNFDEDQNELDIPDLGGCYPAYLDRDGDGICDQNDPDPDDPCLPIMVDSDGDGVCDPIDPDPNDPCLPLFLDTDGDGVCDTSDPDPNDPCDPNNLDTDGDGVCNLYDGDPTVPFIPFVVPVNGNCLPLTDYNGDHRLQLGTAPGGLAYDIQNLEKLTNYPVVNSPYDALNVIESKEALHKILHSTPVLRQQSEILATAYDNLCDDDILDVIEVEYLLEDYHKQSNNTNNNIKKKELYLQRLSKLAAFLIDTIPGDSIHLVSINLAGEAVFEDIKNLYNQLNNDKVTKQQILINKINALPQTNSVYSTLKEYYQIFYNRFILENPLSFADTTALSLIADLCPLEYGKVVYKAREMLLGEGFREEDDFADNCLSVEFRRKETETVSEYSSLYCNIYPNPVQDKVFIKTTFQIAEIHLFNHLGTPVFENKNLSGNSYEVSAESLPGGLYYFTIYGNKGEKIFKKVIFVR